MPKSLYAYMLNEIRDDLKVIAKEIYESGGGCGTESRWEEFKRELKETAAGVREAREERKRIEREEATVRRRETRKWGSNG